MTGYGQFCAVARAHEVLGGRWTLLVVREILSGSSRFNDIRRGIPRISRTVLSERLQDLVHAGAIVRREGAHGPEYTVTEAGTELAALIGALGTWGQRWLPRDAQAEDLDLEPVLVDMRRRVRFDRVPKEPMVLRFALRGHGVRFMLLRQGEASLCRQNPGFPEPLCLRGSLPALAAWWRGDVDWAGARRMGLVPEGSRTAIRECPAWFDRYLFASVTSAAQAVSSPA
jgi:DNA-binding HxlR family transcriptional regulator